MKDEIITVEICGDRKQILKSKLPRVMETSRLLQAAARKANISEEQIQERFTLKVVEDDN